MSSFKRIINFVETYIFGIKPRLSNAIPAPSADDPSIIRGGSPIVTSRPIIYRPGQVHDYAGDAQRDLIFVCKWAYCDFDCKQFHPENESGFDKMPPKRLDEGIDYIDWSSGWDSAEDFGGAGCGDSGR